MFRKSTIQTIFCSFFFSFFISTTQQSLFAQCTSPDTTKPIARCRNATVYLDTTGNVIVNPLRIDNFSSDNCSTWYLWLDHDCFDCTNIGTKTVTLFVQDAAKNRTSCTAILTIKDSIKPKLLLKSSISMPLTAAQTIFTPQQFIQSVTDNCSPMNKMTFGIRKVGAGTGFPTTLTQLYTCADTGKQNIEIWVKDSTGNVLSKTTSFQLTAGTACGRPIPNTLAIMGNIKTESDRPIDAIVTLSGGATLSVRSNAFNFADLLRGGNFGVAPTRDNDWVNGVTTFDISIISKHILDITPITSLYKLIAADVNRDGSIDGADMLLTRNLVLGRTTKFANNTSWRFMPKSVTPTTSADGQPMPDFKETITYTNLNDTVRNADFVAIKIGDVSGSAANTSLTSGRQTPLLTRGTPFVLSTENIKLQAGKTQSFIVSAVSLDLAVLQFTLGFDNRLIKIKNIQTVDLEGFSDNNYAIFEKEGKVTLSWNGAELKSNQLFKITIEAQQNGFLKDVLTLNSDITAAEAYNTEGVVKDVNLVFEAKNLPNGQAGTEGSLSEFLLLPNAPNPFKNETTIRFRLPSDDAVKLTVLDETGRVLAAQNRAFSKGYNEWTIDLSDKKTSGILFYRVETATHSAVGRMVILK
jgi:Dockerin type I domain